MKRIISVILAAALLMSFVCTTASMEAKDSYSINQVHEYSVLPGSEDWKLMP